MKYIILLVVCLVNLIQMSEAQQTICAALETNVDYKGNDFSFTYDAKTAQGLF